MKGWERMANLVQHPTSPCPGDVNEYYWDYLNKKWVYITDDMDMTWAWDRVLGYDSGPEERLNKTSKTILGKEWKLINKTRLEGDTFAEIVEDIKKKSKQIEEQCKGGQ